MSRAPRASAPLPPRRSTRSPRPRSCPSPGSSPTGTPPTASWSTRSALERPSPSSGPTRGASPIRSWRWRASRAGRKRCNPPPPVDRSAGWPRSTRSPGRSSSCAPSIRRMSPGRRGALMAESSRSSSELRSLLLAPADAERLDAHGRTEAAVLVPMHGWPGNPGLVFTERRSDLKRHAGEISFPGGRRDEGEELLDTAIREAEEEIGLSRDRVEIVGALPPIGTFVTNYKVHPFVGLIEEGMRFEPSPSEVESVLVASLDELEAAYEKRRLVRRGVPIKTDTYLIGESLIWGATARILALLLERIRP